MNSTSLHTPGPWSYDTDHILAPDPDGIHPDIYIAEIAHEDQEGPIASAPQQDANRKLIAAAPALLTSIKHLLEVIDEQPVLILSLRYNHAIAATLDAIADAEERT